MANYKWPSAVEPDEGSPIESCDVSAMGCGVVGLVPPAACCTASTSSPAAAAFNRWIGRGYCLEDWAEPATVHYEPDPAA